MDITLCVVSMVPSPMLAVAETVGVEYELQGNREPDQES